MEDLRTVNHDCFCIVQLIADAILCPSVCPFALDATLEYRAQLAKELSGSVSCDRTAVHGSQNCNLWSRQLSAFPSWTVSIIHAEGRA